MIAPQAVQKRSKQIAVQTTQEDSLQVARTGFVSLFEDALMRNVRVEQKPIFEPLLIVDMRGGYVQILVLSLGTDGSFRGIPRPIKVEVAEQFTTAVERTPLCLYRKGASPTWVACSSERLQALQQRSEFLCVPDLLAYAHTLPEVEKGKTFARMWGAFLMPFTEVDSGQDYQKVVFVVDDIRYLSVLQLALRQLAPRLEKGGGKKWETALFASVESTVDLSGYAFFHRPRDVGTKPERYLLLTQPDQGVEYMYDGASFHTGTLTEKAVLVSRYQRIAAVGIQTSDQTPAVILTYTSVEAFQIASLMGYLYWWMQIDDARLNQLRERQKRLLNQLSAINEKADRLRALSLRMSRVLQMNATGGNK